MRRTILFASSVLLITLILALWLQGRQPKPVALTPTLTGETEYCLTCHADLPEISASHPLSTFGCVICHGGERLALNANLAHSTMRGGKNPSDLAVVEVSCGGANCHSGTSQAQRDHIQRVTTSIQATYAGAIANLRYTFGAQPDLTARLGITAVRASAPSSPIQQLLTFIPEKETSSALQAFGKNCLSCHLSAEPKSGPEYARFTGCAACHAAPPQEKNSVHLLTTTIAYSQCDTCHNRGNYDLRAMQFHPRADQPTDRLHDYYQPIAQFTRCEWTLDCADCHTRQEVMGDGNLYSSKKEIQYIRCKTCHGTLTELPQTYTIGNPMGIPAGEKIDGIALRLAFLNPVLDLKLGDTILITTKGEPLWNIRQLPNGSFELFGKATGQRFTFRPVKGSACQQKPDQQESRYCHECHAVIKDEG